MTSTRIGSGIPPSSGRRPPAPSRSALSAAGAEAAPEGATAAGTADVVVLATAHFVPSQTDPGAHFPCGEHAPTPARTIVPGSNHFCRPMLVSFPATPLI